MQKPNIDTLALVATLATAIAIQSWPAVVLFVSAATFRYLGGRRDDDFKHLQDQVASLRKEVFSAAQAHAAQQVTAQALESRLVTLENVVALGQSRTTF